jgi:hypothetical protein
MGKGQRGGSGLEPPRGPTVAYVVFLRACGYFPGRGGPLSVGLRPSRVPDNSTEKRGRHAAKGPHRRGD